MNPSSVDASVAPMMKSVDAPSEKRGDGERFDWGTTRRCLMRAILPQNGGHRQHDETEIAERRPRIDVPVVGRHPFLERTLASPVALPQARDALRHRQPAQRKAVVMLNF